MEIAKIIPLDGTWQLYIEENKNLSPALISASSEAELISAGLRPIDGSVPGNFEPDMERAGLLPDLFFGENILLAQKLENRHLWYCREFASDFSGGDDVFLVFDGIDTFAEVFLNGGKIGSADNMLIPHEFPAHSLKKGRNELLVHILPTALEARKHPLGANSSSGLPYNYGSLPVRKAPYMFGWDIMPRAVSGGIWKSVRVEKRSAERIDELYFYSSDVSRKGAGIRFYYKLAVTGDFIRDYRLKVSGVCKDSSFTHIFDLWHTEGTLGFHIENPRLWWPRDMGDPDLYDIRTELYRGDEKIAEKSVRFGVRSVRLVRTSLTDNDGSGEFRFDVNGEKLFARGTNWVPLDAFPSRNPERLPKALSLLYEANCNMVRLWGGNAYEDGAFYDFCDEHGIAVWQDFCMGCAIYPQDEAFRRAFETEVVAVVKALRQHASIFLWAGDNECDSTYALWGPLRRDPNKNLLTRSVIPAVLERHDPFRPYLPSSPYIDAEAFASGRDDTPENHLWGPRDYYKGSFYKDAIAHFASETGYHGCPSPASIEKFISKDRLWPWKDNTEWLVHASSMEKSFDGAYAYRIPLMASQVRVLFGDIPDGLSPFALASQISQSEALKFFIERFRISKWRRTGILWWNLLDGWPQFSDAVVDYYYGKKLAFHTVKRVTAPLCLMLGEPEGGELTLYGANEYLEDKEVSYKIANASGEELFLSGKATIKANSTAALGKIPYSGDAYRFYRIEWTDSGETFKNHYLSGKAPYPFEKTVSDLRAAELLEIEGF